MQFSRNLTVVVNYILDNICPPILRDCYPLMYPIYRVAYGKPTAKLLKYKDHYPSLSDAEYNTYYELAATTQLSARPTDLNKEGIRFVFSNVIPGGTCLDAGCGRGWLASKLASEERVGAVTGMDIESPSESALQGYTFVQGSLEDIPFPDATFDTVVCCHVLEHVRDLNRVLSELLRVSRKRLIIVLPRQREYRYVADLHIRYFPYLYNIQMAIPLPNAVITRVGSDWGILVDKAGTH